MLRTWRSAASTCLLAGCSGSDSAASTDGGVAGQVGAAGSAGASAAGAGGDVGGGGAAGAAGGPSDGGSAGAAGSGAAAFTCPSPLVAGYNDSFQVGDQTRKLYVDYPKDTSKPLPVVFSFHGFGDSAENFREALALEPDGDADFPFVLVTPDDLGLFPFNNTPGLGWAIFTGAASMPNPEGDLFETVMACLQRDAVIDPARIYVVGFSAGAILTNLMHMRYQQGSAETPAETPHVPAIAAVVSYSGAWFDDPAVTAMVHPLNFKVDYAWDDLDPSRGGTILMTHGGPNDSFAYNGQKVLDFEQAAALALPFLSAAKRTVIDCKHTLGHTPHPGVRAKQVTSFFKAHRAGEPSPYLTDGLDPALPSSCTLEP